MAAHLALDEPSVPARIGDYEILGTLGEGGMGIVYAGRQPDIGKRVAVKVLRAEASAERDLVERFVDEARVVNEIRHRGIVDIFGFGCLPDRRYYLVMEHLEGRSLEQVLEQEGRISVARALEWVAQILEALIAAHAAGVIHRDLKPSNLFLVEQPRQARYVKLLDFGIAKLTSLPKARTQQAMMIGSPDYMAPEQVLGRPVTFATDLYALGCLMYELLSGQRPFATPSVAQTLNLKLHGSAPSLSQVDRSLPREVVRLVEGLMEREAAHRPQTAEEVLERVLTLRAQFPARLVTPTPKKMPAKPELDSTAKHVAPLSMAHTRPHRAVTDAERDPSGEQPTMLRGARRLRLVPPLAARQPLREPCTAPANVSPTPKSSAWLWVVLMVLLGATSSAMTAWALLAASGANALPSWVEHVAPR